MYSHRVSRRPNINLESLLEIEFVICDPHRPPVQSEVQKAHDSLFSIVTKFVSQNSERYKFLKRCEPAFSTPDEKKQLRCYGVLGYELWAPGIKGTLRFSQDQCAEGSYFKLNELLEIAEFMRREIEKVLCHNIFGSNIVMKPINTEKEE